MSESPSDLDKRVRELEKKAALATGAAAVFAVFFGATNFYYIPKVAKEAARDTTSGRTEEEMSSILEKSKKEAAQISKLSQDNKTILESVRDHSVF